MVLVVWWYVLLQKKNETIPKNVYTHVVLNPVKCVQYAIPIIKKFGSGVKQM